MQKQFSEIPANRFFDFSLVSCSEKHAELRMPLKPSYLQEGDVVHGGIISALADTTAVYAIYPGIPGDQTMTSIEFKVNFLAPALLADGDLRAVANVVKRGKKIAVCEVDVLQKKKLVAKGLFTYLIFKRKD